MRPHGTIYHAAKDSPRGELRIALSDKEKKHFRLMRFLGTNLSSFALTFLIFYYGPSFELNMDYEAGLSSVATTSAKEYVAEDVGIARKKEEDTFSLSIPKIGASSVVVPDINPFDSNAYEVALKAGIAHAKGTGKPGGGKRIFLFAHSTNSPLNYSEYNAIFYQLRLLAEGDRIFINHNGDTYIYIVKQKEIVSATDTHWLTETGDKEQLVLQTCDPPGTTLRRLLVIAEPMKQ